MEGTPQDVCKKDDGKGENDKAKKIRRVNTKMIDDDTSSEEDDSKDESYEGPKRGKQPSDDDDDDVESDTKKPKRCGSTVGKKRPATKLSRRCSKKARDEEEEGEGDDDAGGKSAPTIKVRHIVGDPAPGSRKFVGAHVSIAKSIDLAVARAVEVGCRSFAIFTKSQRRFDAKPLDAASIRKFKAACASKGFPPHLVLPHCGYMVNLGAPDREALARSKQSMRLEMQRCAQLGLRYLNFHAGSTKRVLTPAQGVAQVADVINEMHADPSTGDVVAVIENSAHKNPSIGCTFEEIAAIIARVHNKERVGVCLDTCHLFGGGYDIRTPEKFAAVMEKFDKVIGLRYLKGVHINDSLGGFNTGQDHHANVGQGSIGVEAFRWLMNSPIFNDMPLIIENKGPFAPQIRFLQSLEARGGDSAPLPAASASPTVASSASPVDASSTSTIAAETSLAPAAEKAVGGAKKRPSRAAASEKKKAACDDDDG